MHIQTSQPPKLLDRVRQLIRARHYSRRTEEAYASWIRQFIVFHGKRHPMDMGTAEVARFLTWLATERHVASGTQNQALSALLFLYKDVLSLDIGDLGRVPRAKSSIHVPVVLSVTEVRAVLAELHGVPYLVASLLYGAGLRLQECLDLRVKDLDFDRREITVRRGKGQKDRRVMLPDTIRERLQGHLLEVRRTHERDLAAGRARAEVPERADRLAVAVHFSGGAPLSRRALRAADTLSLTRVGGPARGHRRSASRRSHQARHLPRLPAFLCDASSRERLGYPDRTGASGPSGREYDDGVHARIESRWTGRSESHGSALTPLAAKAPQPTADYSRHAAV